MITMIKTSWRVLRRALNRTWIVIAMIITAWFTAGMFFSLIEGKSVFEGLWWASVTGSTTGYGDYYPVTAGGRILGVSFMVFSFIIASFFTAHVVAAVMEDKNKFTHDEQERDKAGMWLLLRYNKLIPEDSVELPSLAWFKEQGYRESADE